MSKILGQLLPCKNKSKWYQIGFTMIVLAKAYYSYKCDKSHMTGFYINKVLKEVELFEWPSYIVYVSFLEAIIEPTAK